MAGGAPVAMRRHRYQDFSLPSQPRDRSDPFATILGQDHAGRGVGLVGWRAVFPDAIDAPAYIADARAAWLSAGTVENATDLADRSGERLRVINDVEQLAAF